MRNLKKFLALVLAFVMAMSLMVTVNAAPAKPEDFGDVSAGSSSYAEAINVLSALGVINGYETDDGTIFNPKGEIKRSEVAAILYRIANNDAAEEQVGIYKDYNRFSDVPSDAWYAGAVNYCANSELVVGVGDDRYAPHSKVTGYQVLAMALRMLGYDQNGEFEGSGWQIRTASYARQVGLTKNIKEGTLGANATREMVAEIMFQALQAPTVSYNLLRNYYPNDVLIADNEDNRTSYGNAIAANVLTLPLNGNLMYRNYGIVGKTAGEPDPFGRPTEAWVVDADDDVAVDKTNGTASKYIVNRNDLDGTGNWDDADIGDGADTEKLSIALTPVAVYTDAIDECHLTKDINNDKSIWWAAITEILNGQVLDSRDAGVVGGTLDNATGVDGNGDTVKLDALHTSTKFVNATGRTIEIYKGEEVTLNAALDDEKSNLWTFVYIDTFLGEVTGVTEEVKDSAGHTIIESKATVELGNKLMNAGQTAAGTPGDATDKPVKLTLDNPDGKYKKGDLVLVQTSNATLDTLSDVDNPEKAPLAPEDVPNTYAMFATNADDVHMSSLLPVGATTKRVTIKGTVGARDAKMGVITEDGDTFMASNTFLASRTIATGYGNNTNKTFSLTVLPKWYGVDVAELGITNSMIGRTYDIVLDQNDHIVGMKEVLTINSTVGVITAIDSVRVSSGKYMSEVEAYMSDGTTQTFRLFDMGGELTAANVAAQSFDTSAFSTFGGYADADAEWDAGKDYCGLGIGSLVMFKQATVEGIDGWYICDFDTTANVTMKDKTGAVIGTAGTGGQGGSGEGVQGHLETGEATIGTLGQVATGVTGTLNGVTDIAGERNATKLDDKSVIFVAEYEYRYNTSGNNDGSNINKTYEVYEGFKKMPTITGLNAAGTATNIMYQQLTKNTQYVLVYAQQENLEYTIKNQDKIAVDDSYLVLSRGATYATYSEYNVLKNGEQTTLQVSNANTQVNQAIEATMTNNQLLVVTGRNAAGYVTSVSTVTTLASASTPNTVAVQNTAGLTAYEVIAGAAAPGDISYKNGVLKTTAAGQYLTLDDNVKVQLVNRDQKTVTEISMDVAMVYANNTDGKLNAAKPMVFELNELGYVCNLYVIE